MADMLSAAAEKIKALMYEQGRYHVNLVGGVEKEVYTLADDLITLTNVLNDAENRRFKDKKINSWLSKLERASYEMEDVLDLWNYAILDLRIPDVAPLNQKVLSFVKEFSTLSFQKAASRHNIAQKILNVKALVDEILKEKDQYSFVISQRKADSWPIHTSLFDSGELVGLDRDRDILVSKLMGNGEELGIQAVSIVGAGGVGKTTLARLVYNDSRVEESFELRIWVSVSGPFDLVVIAKEILESIKKGSSPSTNQMNSLLDDVKESILGKKFFIVLDGVSMEDTNEWEHLENSLGCGGVGSKILVTTRNERVVDMLGLKDSGISRLGLLSDEDCWLLLSRIALSGRNKVEFEDTGKEIARKCDGVPFAVVILGNLLRFKNNLEEWQGVLNSEIWEIKGGVVELFPYLILYYNKLSQTLKRCFLYCASFPKDTNIDVEDLIRKWMALGYLGSEDRGRESFDILVMHSLFRDFVRDDQDEKIMWCKMHDVAHDFAQFLRKSSRVEAEGMNACQKCDPLLVSSVNEFCSLYCTSKCPSNLCDCLVRLRLLSLHSFGMGRIPQGLENMIHLRWLDFYHIALSSEGLKIIFQLYNLQKLSLKCCCIEEVPREIGNLIHLTHLSVTENKIFVTGNKVLYEFPSEIGKLINLTHLTLSEIPSLKELPREIGNLIHLTHLEVTKNESLMELPSEIGNLIQLIHLDLSVNKSLKKLPCEIGNLIHLRRLNLRINNSLKELPEEIGNLTQLTHLDLSYNTFLEKLPESIRGLQKLQTLKIDYCDYLWMPEALALLTGLRSLGDLGQKNLWQLRLLKNLNNLRGSLALAANISHSEGLVEAARNANLRKKVSIEKLEFYFTGMRDEPSSSRVGMDVLDALEPHPNLKEVRISNFNGSKLPLWMLSPLNQLMKFNLSCSVCLTSLPAFGKLPCLEEFRASRVEDLQFVGREFLGIGGVGESSSYIAFPRLKILEIEGCEKWKEWEDITEEEEESADFQVMPCLRELRIEFCKALTALPIRLLSKASLLEKWNFSGSTLLEQCHSNNDPSSDPDDY